MRDLSPIGAFWKSGHKAEGKWPKDHSNQNSWAPQKNIFLHQFHQNLSNYVDEETLAYSNN